MSEWQDISTAPHDGTDILVIEPDTHIMLVVGWDDEPPIPFANWATLDGPNYHAWMFSHWMPLPPPPETAP
ncbi:hypothetical protein LB518_23050 [Mesorhizobium sp. BR1-1-16]|uniref:hypothetical protein n=1 Tax=Mesorhizobium sp. BR1-1-16 TaxID=2876653 RepID=UPI001CCDC6DD|nr:hypothetical protein [Mesorhizobium sp. BR1-1-16]MBZ9939194.1 hypothetical protein [Mesorhizobium sp. BR1-1-16]